MINKIIIRIRFEIASAKLRFFHPELYFQIKKLVGVMADGYQLLRVPMKKNFDLLWYLNKYRPGNIVELGSGTTSATFSYYAERTQCRVLTLESHVEWFNLLRASIEFKEINYKYMLANIKYGDGWTMFDWHHNQTDFLYLDGPQVDQTYPYNYDVIGMLEHGIRPKVIVFDVRRETVEKTLDYIRKNSIPYQIGKPVSGDRRHTILELINPPLR